MTKHTLVYQGKSIEFMIIRKKVKNINLRIKADLSVVVSANNNVPLDLILAFVQEKALWILERLEKFSQMQQMVQPTQYVSGEEFRLLGRVLILKVIESKTEKVIQNGSYLELYVHPKAMHDRKRQIIDNFFLEQAKAAFNAALARMLAKADLNFIPSLKVRRMTSRWGSCLVHKKTVVLNSRLIHTLEACIDYVLLHELLHFANPNHGRSFYNTLTALMPDWREFKRELDNASRG